jgi:hypothetical protein
VVKANAAAPLRFRDEVRDFFRFVRHPRLAPRMPGRPTVNGGPADWFPSVSVGRLLKWACLLWAVNLVFLGPIAVSAAGAGGAQHRFDLQNIPWLQALLWAPVVEELVFRYGLRHIGQALWLVPAAVVALVAGPNWATITLVGLLVLLCWLPYMKKSGSGPGPALPWHYREVYVRSFPWVFHAVSLSFAAVHLNNFSLNQMPYWLMPLLVLPQWLTGLVLGWLRVKRGIGASMLLHGLFNGGPLLVVWLVLRAVGELPA